MCNTKPKKVRIICKNFAHNSTIPNFNLDQGLDSAQDWNLDQDFDRDTDPYLDPSSRFNTAATCDRHRQT